MLIRGDKLYYISKNFCRWIQNFTSDVKKNPKYPFEAASMLLSIKQILAIPDPRFPANPFYQLLSYQKDVKNPTNLVQWQDIDLTKSDGRSDFLINHLEDTESNGTTSDSSDDFVMISKNSLNG